MDILQEIQELFSKNMQSFRNILQNQRIFGVKWTTNGQKAKFNEQKQVGFGIKIKAFLNT